MLLYDRNIIGPSSEIFGNLRKMFGNVRFCFGTILENLRRVVGNLRKIVKNVVIIVCLYNKQNTTYSCSTRHLTRSLRPLVKYLVEHSKIKFISTRGHV